MSSSRLATDMMQDLVRGASHDVLDALRSLDGQRLERSLPDRRPGLKSGGRSDDGAGVDASAADAQERRRAAIDLARTTIDAADQVRLRPGCTVLATSLQQAIDAAADPVAPRALQGPGPRRGLRR